MKLDDLTESAMRRTVRKQAELQREMRSNGMELSTVIATAMIADVALALTAAVGAEPTEQFLHGATALFAQHVAMTDLEWSAYQHGMLDWAELAVKHLGPHLDDPDEARHVGLIVADVIWHLGDLLETENWVTSLMKRVTSSL